MSEKKKVAKKSKEKVCEIFDVEKDGKIEEIKKCGEQEIEEEKKDQSKKENILLRNVFILTGLIIVIFLATYFAIQATKTFEYRGMNFDIKDEANVRFYHTSFPLKMNGQLVTYNVFLRKDPRKNEANIPFGGRIEFSDKIVLNAKDSFNCDGKGILAIANFEQIFTALGGKIFNDANATCDTDDRYVFLEIVQGEKSEIRKTGSKCYKLVVNNCEILEVTERFITETLFNLGLV